MPCLDKLSQAELNQMGRAPAHRPWLLQEHHPPASPCLTCRPQPSTLPLPGVLQGWLFPQWQTHQLCPLSPPHQGSLPPPHPWAAPHQSPSPSCLCSHQTSLLLATVPYISGCSCSPSACHVRLNGDMFDQHSPFTHLPARRGVKPPGPSSAGSGGTQGQRHAAEPQLLRHPRWPQLWEHYAQAGLKVAVATFIPRIAPQGWGASRTAGCSAPGCGHCREPMAPAGQGRCPAVGEGHGPHGQGDAVPMEKGLWPSWMRDPGVQA